MATIQRLTNVTHYLRIVNLSNFVTITPLSAANMYPLSKNYSHATKKSINVTNGSATNLTAAVALLAVPSSPYLKRNYCSVLKLQQQHKRQQQSSPPSSQELSSQCLRPQQQYRKFSNIRVQMHPQPLQSNHFVRQQTMTPLKNRRFISSHVITKNMILYSNTNTKQEVDSKTLEFKKSRGNPLVVMMAWLLAKQKHLKKYAEIYTDMGFDVMVVHITPWQLLWPTKGTQIVAAEAIKFLDNNKLYSPIVLHGFSVGAYQFGEIMLQMSQDMQRYAHILNRIACQIWDSAADITEIPVGLPKAIFPKNHRMQSALRNYTLYHLKTFHNQATIHYMRSSQMFHSTLCKKPALFFVSENDPIGPPSSNNTVRENWERADIKVTFKCWERSMHAAHFIKHRDEYLEFVYKHLENAGVLESIGLKTRAKL